MLSSVQREADSAGVKQNSEMRSCQESVQTLGQHPRDSEKHFPFLQKKMSKRNRCMTERIVTKSYSSYKHYTEILSLQCYNNRIIVCLFVIVKITGSIFRIKIGILLLLYNNEKRFYCTYLVGYVFY